MYEYYVIKNLSLFSENVYDRFSKLPYSFSAHGRDPLKRDSNMLYVEDAEVVNEILKAEVDDAETSQPTTNDTISGAPAFSVTHGFTSICSVIAYLFAKI